MFYEEIFRELQHKRIRYLVIGGVAVNLHGFSRTTGDLDILLSMDQKNLGRFVGMIKSLGWKPRLPVELEDFIDSHKREGWIKEKNMKVFSVYNPKKEIEHIDVMVENYIDFDKAYEKREEVFAGDVKIAILSIQDLIQLKEIAARERDKIDINALRKIQELKNAKKKEKKNEEYDIGDLKRYMTFPAKKKLEYLEEMNQFFSTAMPATSKKIWEEMQKQGW